MLDIKIVRADFAAYLAAHAGTKHSLDAALMHVVEQAYRQGLDDGAMQHPAQRISMGGYQPDPHMQDRPTHPPPRKP